MKNLKKYELVVINGGSTNPTYDVSDNYNALIDNTKTAVPYAFELLKAFARDIMKAIFL